MHHPGDPREVPTGKEQRAQVHIVGVWAPATEKRSFIHSFILKDNVRKLPNLKNGKIWEHYPNGAGVTE